MTAANYQNCLKITLAYEGGYSNHPKDPGGVTLEGIIQRVYDEYRRQQGKPQKVLTPQMRGTAEWIIERNDIYRQNYWSKVVGDQWPPGADLAVWDCGVNSGPGRAKQFVDAILGKSTTWGTQAAAVRAKGDSAPFVKAFCGKRLAFVQGLKTWATFGGGWGKRIANVEAHGVRMTLQAQGVAPAEQKKKLEAEAADAKASASNHAKGAGGTTVATGGGGSQVDWTTTDWLALGGKIAAAAVAVILILYCVHWWRAHRERAKAYAAVAGATGG